MDEKPIAIDSLKLWSETDSSKVLKKVSPIAGTGNQWIQGAAVVVGITILLFVLFNVRSK
jgi:hypothetical protein